MAWEGNEVGKGACERQGERDAGGEEVGGKERRSMGPQEAVGSHMQCRQGRQISLCIWWLRRGQLPDE